MSNDPPLAYYLLTPFVLLFGNSFIGVKIGMALMGSLMVLPAYLLTECYTKEKVGGSKIPALLSAFMVTVNVNYFALIGDFLQNLVGVLLLVVFLYFAVMWFADSKNWRKYGVLTVIFLCLNLLTHIYTGAVAVTLFFSLLIFSIVFKTYKIRKLPLFDLKILGMVSVLVLAFFTVLFLTYPVMYAKFSTVMLSFINSSTTQTGVTGRGVSSPVSGIIFLSLPYILGIVTALIILYRGLKERITTLIPVEVDKTTVEMSKATIMMNNTLYDNYKIHDKNFHSKMNKNTLLVWAYISMAVLLAVLVSIPASDYQSRFLLMAFLPVGLLVPLGLKFIETEFLGRYSKKTLITILIAGVALIFAFSCFYTASESFNNLEPTITPQQYNELLEVKASFANVTNENLVIVASDFQNKYWVEYVLGDMGNGNNVTVVESVQGVQENYQNSTIYTISTQNNQTSSSMGVNGISGPNAGGAGSSMDENYSLSFLLPYGPPILPNSLDLIPSFSNGSQTTQNSMQGGNQPTGGMFNNTNSPHGNKTANGGVPGNLPSNGNQTNNIVPPPGNMNNQTNLPQGNNMGSGGNDQSRQTVDSLTSSGTTIFSGNYFKIIRIQL
ncbi:glycosyltransferase family 39 protein [uncultured Methanobacterium sp.]|uniref:glycosyltransferase family 39 protein n=1 Tax=uncultured Methanobacterium sp. TaxID=176306 RepID=UPI003748D77E